MTPTYDALFALCQKLRDNILETSPLGKEWSDKQDEIETAIIRQVEAIEKGQDQCR